MNNNNLQAFISANNYTREKVGEGVYRTIIAYDERVMVVKVEFEKGAVGALHQHFHTQVSYIEKGVFEVEINGEKKILETGSSFYIAPNLPHAVVCLQAGVLIDVFAPAREDFIL